MRLCAKRRASVRPEDDAQSARDDPKGKGFHNGEMRDARGRDIDRVAAPKGQCREIARPAAPSAKFHAPRMWLRPRDRHIEPNGSIGCWNFRSHMVPVRPRSVPDVVTRAMPKIGYRPDAEVRQIGRAHV